MAINYKKWGTIIISSIAIMSSLSAQNKIVNIDATQSVAKVASTMWGVFFEDINFGADGGLYAELIKNRSFEFTQPFMGWKKLGIANREGVCLIENREKENPKNPRFLRVKAGKTVKGELGLENEGFRGMGIKQGVGYDFSIWYRTKSEQRNLIVELADSIGNIIGSGSLAVSNADGQWHQAKMSFKATATVMKAHVTIWLVGDGDIDLDMISLFPQDTWKHRPGGLRADMVQRLADMKPGFIRFPGGCIVEGRDLANRYQWKNTVGPIEERKTIMNRWNVEFAHRPAPDYFQSFGLGFYEYFQLAEDIGAEPLPIINCGMACQFNTSELQDVAELDPYVQDALDLIEFANGPTTTKWGKLRADMGHPAPFNLKMVGIGNENWGPQYLERLHLFQDALREKYPKIKLVCSSGTDPDGDRFDLLNDSLRKMNVGFIDEHYYRTPEWFLDNVTRYDNYPRNGSKVFAGEYAAQSNGIAEATNKNSWITALAEAAFMTGLERNAAVVQMASYAPLFAHTDAWQWTPDMIWVNNLKTYATPDYYVQQLYSLNKGTDVVAATIDGKAVSGQDKLYLSTVKDLNTKEIIVKIVNASNSQQSLRLDIKSKEKLKPGKSVVLTANSLLAVNGFDDPENVAPKSFSTEIKKNQVILNAAANSFYVIKITY
ncbi:MULTISPECIES: alpha-L-arabinofuranosidase C-terminal domain-containing protein [Chitinophagaceae]